MTAVFSHGRLRLYLLRLLDDGPKHGYELIRLLEERFLGLYAPSAGTIYPRLQRLEADGLVTHTAAGGRKVYEITESGRAELRQRADEVTTLETDITASVEDLSALAGEIQTEVRGSVRDLKRELREATRQTRQTRWDRPVPGPTPRPAPGSTFRPADPAQGDSPCWPISTSDWPSSPSRSARWSGPGGSATPSSGPRSGSSTAHWTGCADCCADGRGALTWAAR